MTSRARHESPSGTAFLSDVFHELSQPLTALHCLLDFALQRDTTVEELRASVEKALANAERLRQRLVLLRAIYYAADPGFTDRTADLNQILRQLQEDLLPVFLSQGQELRIEPCGHAVLVKSDHSRLAGALFYCLEYLLRYSGPDAATNILVKVASDHLGEVRITSDASLPVFASGSSEQEIDSFEFELARRTFRAAGGDFAVVTGHASKCVCRGTLPLA